MDSEAAFKNIWIPRRKPLERGALELVGQKSIDADNDAAAAAAEEGLDNSGDSEEAFAAALKTVSGNTRIAYFEREPSS